MTMRVVVVAVIVGLSAGGAAHAQTRPLRPDERLAAQYVDPVAGLAVQIAVEQALEREPSLRAARSDVDVATGMRLQAGLRPNPTVSFAQQDEPAGTDAQTRIEVQWPLDLFRRAGRVAVADRQIEATRNATADRERALASDVRTAYGDVAAAVRELSVTDELVSVTSAQLDLVGARVEQGAAPPLERDILRVELQRLESERVLQAGRVERALIALKRLIGLRPEAPLRIRDTLEQLVEMETGASLPFDNTVAAGNRPDVQEAQARLQVADAEIDRARREGRFDVSLFGTYMRMDAGFPQRGFTATGGLARVRGVFHYVAGGAMVTVPIRNRNQGEVAAARAQRTGEAARLEAAQLSAHAEIAEARARDEYARRAAAVYTTDARALARQNLDVTRQTYELGRATVVEVLTEHRLYLDVERGYTAALREVYEARQALRRALGEVR